MQVVLYLLDLILPPRASALLVRSATEDAIASYLSPTLHTLGMYSVTTLLPYHEPFVQACIQETKYHHNTKAARLLAYALQEYLTEAMDEYTLARTPLFVPIPLGTKRRKERGYNQVERVLKEAAILPTQLLCRRKETAPQTTLKRQARLKNMQGAFEVTGPVYGDTPYIVVDDVFTTGATLLSAMDTLYEAGAREVRALTLAH